MLRDSVVVVVRMHPRAIPLAMITMRNSTHGFPFVFHMWVAYGAPLLSGKLFFKYKSISMQCFVSTSSGDGIRSWQAFWKSG